jgi:hypothetical protein
MLARESRVYSRDFNGAHRIYFEETFQGMQEMARHFAELPLRDHEVHIKAGPRRVRSFEGQEINCNVEIYALGGIMLLLEQQKERPDTLEPILTLYVDTDHAEELCSELELPPNIILHNEVEDCGLESPAQKPEREVFYVNVGFDEEADLMPNVEGLHTWITMWTPRHEEGIYIGSLHPEGLFHTGLSKEEKAALDGGQAALTISVGHRPTPERDDTPLPSKLLRKDKKTASEIVLDASYLLRSKKGQD